MAKFYRVQDLAGYNRNIPFDDGEVAFEGHFANVPEKYLSYFSQSSDYQVIGNGFEKASPKFASDEKPKEVKKTEKKGDK